MDSKPTIIFLNGVGSVGKTSIARVLQTVLDKPYLLIGIDQFIEMLPKQYLPKGKKANEGIEFVSNQTSSDPEIEVRLGPIGKKLFIEMRHTMLLLANAGFNLIIDEVLIGDEFESYLDLFKKHRLLTVGVFAPLEIIERREKSRKNRTLGLARGQYGIVHKGKKYDLEIDTSELTPQDCAHKIKELIDLF